MDGHVWMYRQNGTGTDHITGERFWLSGRERKGRLQILSVSAVTPPVRYQQTGSAGGRE